MAKALMTVRNAFFIDDEEQDCNDRSNDSNLTVVRFEAKGARFLPTSSKEIHLLSSKIHETFIRQQKQLKRIFQVLVYIKVTFSCLLY